MSLVRWLVQRNFKFESSYGPGSKLDRVPPHKKIEKVSVSVIISPNPVFSAHVLARAVGVAVGH